MLCADCRIIQERTPFGASRKNIGTYMYIGLLSGKCMRALARYVPANEDDEALH